MLRYALILSALMGASLLAVPQAMAQAYTQCPSQDFALCAASICTPTGGLIAVNVSGRQLSEPTFPHTVAAVLEETDLSPSFLDLELTESIVMKNAEQSIKSLQARSAMGLRLSIDDSGTGYSSLSYLKRFPINTLKIDRSFMAGVPGDADHLGIVEAIIAMAQSLKLEVLAEGVESTEQLEFLRSKGCAGFQGFLVSPPVPPDELLAFLVSSSAEAFPGPPEGVHPSGYLGPLEERESGRGGGAA